MTEAQQKVIVGQRIRSQTGMEYTVMWTSALGVFAVSSVNAPGDVHWLPWSFLVLPDPPKAKPGVRYRRDMAMSALGYVDQAVGLANGRVLAHAPNGDYASVELDFNDSWREVPE